MSDEPIVIGRCELLPDGDVTGSDFDLVQCEGATYNGMVTMPWSDWLALAKAICQREGLVVLNAKESERYAITKAGEGYP